MLKPPPLEDTEFAGRRRRETVSGLTLAGAVLLGMLSSSAVTWMMVFAPSHNAPIREGYGVNSITVREKDHTFVELKCKGCKVECFDHFVVVHIDRSKEPSWTGDYLQVIPWDKVEAMTLSPRESAQ